MLRLFRVILSGVWFFGWALIFCLVALFRPFKLINGYQYSMVTFPFITKIIGLKIEHRHLDRLELFKPTVIVMNHQDTLDVPIYGSVQIPESSSIGKKELAVIPIFGWLYWLSGHTLINRGKIRSAMGSMAKAETAIREKQCHFWMFPEGTRQWGAGLGKFKKGAFHLAINTQVPIVPLVTSTHKGRVDIGRWRAGKVIIEALEPISTKNLTGEDLNALMEKTRETMRAAIERLDRELDAEPSPA